VVRHRGGGLKKTGAVGIVAVVLVLGYGLYTGSIGIEQLLEELLGGDSGVRRSGPTTARGAPRPPSPAAARAMVGGLEVAPSGSMAGYSREEFPHWAADGTEFGWKEPDGSCDVRDDALIRDGLGIQIDEECSFTTGRWLDPYTSTTLRDPEDVDIDHIVPLANAWRSGANDWGEGEREAYANDPGVLLSVDDSASQAKRDKGTAAWRPPNAHFR